MTAQPNEGQGLLATLRWLLLGGTVRSWVVTREEASQLVVRVLLLARVVFLSVPLLLMFEDQNLRGFMGLGILVVLAHGIWLLRKNGDVIWAIIIDVPFLTVGVLTGGMGSIAAIVILFYLVVARMGLVGWRRLTGTLITLAGLAVVVVLQASHSGPVSVIGTLLGVAFIALGVIRSLEGVETHHTAALEEAAIRAEERSETLAMVAHELSTPLTTGRGALALMEETVVTSEDRELLGLLSGALHDSSVLVSDLRAAVDLERGHIELEPVPFSLAEFGRELAFTHPASDIRLDIAEGLVLADRTRFAQVMHNLISNAERHGRPPVHIAARNGGSTWHITVTDQGAAIPEDERESIFESFTQGSHHGEGMGMGLSVSRKLARAMDGDLDVDDAYEDGTRFVLSLPSA